MNLLGLTTLSFLGTVGVTTKYALDALIEAGDKGYLVDRNKLSNYNKLQKEAKKELSTSKKIIDITKNLAPGYNLYSAGKSIEQIKMDFLEKGLESGYLKPMSKEEKIVYDTFVKTKAGKLTYLIFLSKDPNIANALTASLSVETSNASINKKYNQFKSDCDEAILDFKLSATEFLMDAEDSMIEARIYLEDTVNEAKDLIMKLKNKKK